MDQEANRKIVHRIAYQATSRALRSQMIVGACAVMLAALLCFSTPVFATDVDFPVVNATATIRATATQGSKSVQGSYLVYELRGNCKLQQGLWSAECDEAVLWIDQQPAPSDRPTKIIVYLEGNAHVRWNESQQVKDQHWMGRLFSFFPVDVQAQEWTNPRNSQPLRWNDQSTPSLPALLSDPTGSVQQAQFESLAPPIGSSVQVGPPSSAGGTFEMPSQGVIVDDHGLQGETIPRPLPQIQALSPSSETITANQVAPPDDQAFGARTFSLSGRSSQDVQLQVIQRPERGDSVALLTRGFRIRIGGVRARTSDGTVMDVGTVVLEADRAVIWSRDFNELYSGSIGDQPVEIYLEGNIVFQQGQRVIYADRMYYNVQSEYGMVLSAEILTPAPQYEGLLRLKADVVEQRSRSSFFARDAALTSSRLGVPRYWLQAGRVELTDDRVAMTDPVTGQTTTTARPGGTDMEATSRNNLVYVGGLPIFYWPVLSTNIEQPNFYLTGAKFKNDSIFGSQAMLDWDLYQLLGIDGPNGSSWTLSTDYLSKRGPALGTNFVYDTPGLILPGPAAGYFDFWGIDDKGKDIIGSDRNGMTPEESLRGRLLFRHRQYFTKDLELTAEVGWISDRNFMEQYFEREWDQEKDYTTGLRLRKYTDNRMFDVWGQARLNKFYMETEWLPRLDHYWLGQSIADRFTWYAHTHVGYAHQRIATTPTDPQDSAKFAPLPWEVDAEGIRTATRQELNLPLTLGPAKVVPYLHGEAAYWGEDITGNPLTRLTGQAGIRTSVPIWSVYPNVESRLLDIRGIAHKVTFKSEFFYADTDKNLDQLPLYDPLDDNSQEHFRRRLVFNTFGGTLPAEFDSRSYAIRQGLQRYVTASSTEVVEDQMQLRLGIDQRWQTKRGRRERERITDLVEFDAGMIFFPKPNRDNFGEDVGAFNYDFRYHIGDRLTLLSDGYADVFSQGLKAISLGAMFSRPGRGEWYTGLTSLEGPISSFVLHSNVNYRIGEKWIATGGTAVDLGNVGNIGQTLALTRIGESFLIQVGTAVDSGRDNASFLFNIEPRFISRRRLGSVGGTLVPPAGVNGLE